MTQADLSLRLTCSCSAHTGPRKLPRGWFPRSGTKNGTAQRSSWCRVCLRPLRAAHEARRRSVTGESNRVSHAVVRELWRAQAGRCTGWDERACGVSLLAGYELDHWWPIAHGGRHVAENLRLLCRLCNREKGAKLPRGVRLG